MPKVQVLTITFTDGSRQAAPGLRDLCSGRRLDRMQSRSHFPWSTPEKIANYPLVNIREYHFDSVKA